MSCLAQPRLGGPVRLADSYSDLMHSQFRFFVLQVNPGPARTDDVFHAVILHDTRDHVPHISENFYTYTDGNDLATLLNKDTFVSGFAVFPISEASTSKDTWGLAALVVRGLLRRPSGVDSSTATLCSVHLHNKVAKKRDASTSLLLRLREHMINHSVDFFGGDFNISAVTTVRDVFSDPEFAAPATRSCGASAAWTKPAHRCCKFDNADMGFGET